MGLCILVPLHLIMTMLEGVLQLQEEPSMSLSTVSVLHVKVGGFLLLPTVTGSVAYEIHVCGNWSMQRAVCEEQKIEISYIVTSMMVKATLFPVYRY